MPMGVVGELLLGGRGLARGYLSRPELTAERFVPHPYSEEPGARLYRSGDVVRYREDGALEFVGRRDEQVKIRGYRIELGEIETRLGEYEGIRETVVIAREEAEGDKRLVAYYTGEVQASAEQRQYAVRFHTLMHQRCPLEIPVQFERLFRRSPTGKEENKPTGKEENKDDHRRGPTKSHRRRVPHQRVGQPGQRRGGSTQRVRRMDAQR